MKQEIEKLLGIDEVSGELLFNGESIASVSPDATTSIKGIIKLNGDLGGTADSPTVPGLIDKVQYLTPTGVKTSNYSVQANDLAEFDLFNNPYTATLLNSPADKTISAIKIVKSGTSNTLTVNCSGADVFNIAGGPATMVMSNLNQLLIVQYENSTRIWHVISTDIALGSYVPYSGATTAVDLGSQNIKTSGFGFLSSVRSDHAITAVGNGNDTLGVSPLVGWTDTSTVNVSVGQIDSNYNVNWWNNITGTPTTYFTMGVDGDFTAKKSVNITGSSSGTAKLQAPAAAGSSISVLPVNGGDLSVILNPTSTITTNYYTAAPNDLVRFDCTSSGLNFNLPNAPVDGTIIGTKLIATAGNAMIVGAVGSDVFDVVSGSTTKPLAILNQMYVFQYEASTGIWHTINNDVGINAFVPYTGATTAVNLGTNDFTATGTSVLNAIDASSIFLTTVRAYGQVTTHADGNDTYGLSALIGWQDAMGVNSLVGQLNANSDVDFWSSKAGATYSKIFTLGTDGDFTAYNSLKVSAAIPENRFTTSDSLYARFQRTTASSNNLFLGKNNVLQVGGIGRALEFTSASNQYYTFSDSSFPTSLTTATFTISIWIKYTNTSLQPILNFGDGSDNAGLYLSSGNIGFYTNNGSRITTTPMNDNQYHNILLAFGPSSQSFYVDATLIGTTTLTGTITLTGAVDNYHIGNNTPVYGDYTIDQLLVYSRTLSTTSGSGSSNEIAQIYNSGSGTATPPSSGLIRRYEFEEGTGNMVADINPNGIQYPLTLFNSPTWIPQGIVPISASSSETTFFQITDGLTNAEKGIATWGDFTGRNQQLGKWFQWSQGSAYPLVSNNIGQWRFDPANISNSVPTILSTIDLAGNLTIGSTAAGTIIAPTNGLYVEGSTILYDGLISGGDVNLQLGKGFLINNNPILTISSGTMYAGDITGWGSNPYVIRTAGSDRLSINSSGDINTNGGSVIGKTETVGTNSTNLASTAFVTTALSTVPFQVASGFLSAQTSTGDIFSTYTVGSSDTDFEVEGTINITTTLSTAIKTTVTYTDQNGNSNVQTLNLVALSGNGAVSQNNTGAYSMNQVVIRAKASTTITVATTNTITSGQFDVSAHLVQLP